MGAGSGYEQEVTEARVLTAELAARAQKTARRVNRLKEAHGLPRASTPPGHEPPPLVAFVHIPKTAGGTVTAMFTAAYTKQAIRHTGNYVSGPERTETKLALRPGGWSRWNHAGGRIAVGHTPYGLFQRHMPPGTRYVTFLREPIDRVLSHYYRHVHRPERPRRPRAAKPRQPAITSVEQAMVEMNLPQLNNLATRFLCSEPSLGRLPESALDDAKENLREFAFLGIQERFEESLVLLQRTLDLGVVPYTNRHVSSDGGRPGVDEIPEEQRALIEEHNRFDVELYRFALALFDEAIADVDDEFTIDVERLTGASAVANEEHQASLRAAQSWLDAELPPGTTKPEAELVSKAEPAGIARPALNQARKLAGARREQDLEGRWTWARPRVREKKQGGGEPEDAPDPNGAEHAD